MNKRKGIKGVCMMCALVISALAAQSAIASEGTTAFTCKKGAGVGPETFKTEHCKKADGPGEYDHFAITENTETEITIKSEKTNSETTGQEPSILKETLGGVELELKTTEVSGTGTLTNKKVAETNGEHYVEGGTAFITYSGVKVEKPEGKGCKVFTDDPVTKAKGAEGVIDVHLKSTTKGQGDSIKFEPATGTTFASFFVDCGGKVPAVEGTWEITGSATCIPDGATIRCDHEEITKQNTLKGKGNKAGFQSTVTISGRMEAPESHTPLSVTTVKTP